MALSALEIATRFGIEEARAVTVLDAATALVDRYAPAAPHTLRIEATLRVIGWMIEAPAGGQRLETIGDITTAYTIGAATGAMQASGAKALLAPWRVRRAGAA